MIETSESLASDLTFEVQTIQTEEFVSKAELSTEDQLEHASMKLSRNFAYAIIFVMAETGHTYETMAEKLGDSTGAKTIKRLINNLIEGKPVTLAQVAILGYALGIEWDIRMNGLHPEPTEMNDA